MSCEMRETIVRGRLDIELDGALRNVIGRRCVYFIMNREGSAWVHKKVLEE